MRSAACRAGYRLAAQERCGAPTLVAAPGQTRGLAFEWSLRPVRVQPAGTYKLVARLPGTCQRAYLGVALRGCASPALTTYSTGQGVLALWKLVPVQVGACAPMCPHSSGSS